MTDTERDNLLDKIENEGFEYAINEYGDKIKDPEYKRLRQAYLDASQKLAEYIGVED